VPALTSLRADVTDVTNDLASACVVQETFTPLQPVLLRAQVGSSGLVFSLSSDSVRELFYLETDPVNVNVPAAARDPLVGIIVAHLVCIAASAGCVFYFRGNRVIYSSSPKFCYMIHFGVMFSDLNALLYLYPQTDLLCNLRPWLFVTGFILTYFSCFLKEYRIFKVFDNPKLQQVKMGDDVLLRPMLLLLVLWWVLLGFYTGFDPFHILHPLQQECVKGAWPLSTRTDTLWPLMIGCNSGVILAVTYIAFKVRKVPSLFNESWSVSSAMYAVVVCFLVWMVMAGLELQQQTFAVVSSVVIWFSAFSSHALLFVPKFYQIFGHEGDTQFFNLQTVDPKNLPPKPQRKPSKGEKDSNQNHVEMSIRSAASATETVNATPKQQLLKTLQTCLQDYEKIESQYAFTLKKLQDSKAKLSTENTRLAAIYAEMDFLGVADPTNPNAPSGTGGVQAPAPTSPAASSV
jgi:hypothetical protein